MEAKKETRGRKPLKDKKELVRVYLRQSEIKKLGGTKKAASKLHTLAMLELIKNEA